MEPTEITSEQYGLKELQDKTKEILKDLDRLFKENNIFYCLSDGGVLGAIRHHDFIPWDDDCDIFVLRDQYFKIRDLINEQCSDRYFIDSVWDNDAFDLPIMRIKVKNTTFVDKMFLYDDRIAHNLFIDLFPLFSIPNDVKERKKQRLNAMICSLLTRGKRIKGRCKKSTEMILKVLPVFYGGRKKAIQKTFDNISKYKYEDCECISPILSSINYWGYLYNKKIFENLKYVDCGNIILPIPDNAEEYLTMVYGDYMRLPSEESRKKAQHSLLIDLEHDYTEHLDDIKKLREKYKDTDLTY